MFSMEEKKKIAAAVEKVILDIDHPEMPKKKPKFHLHIAGKEKWSWADILPNWMYEEVIPKTSNWNETARDKMKNK